MTPAEYGCIFLGVVACAAAVWAGSRELLHRMLLARHVAHLDATDSLVELSKKILEDSRHYSQCSRARIKRYELAQQIAHHLRQRKPEHTAKANALQAELDALEAGE
jgi:hypothetical protein